MARGGAAWGGGVVRRTIDPGTRLENQTQGIHFSLTETARDTWIIADAVGWLVIGHDHSVGHRAVHQDD